MITNGAGTKLDHHRDARKNFSRISVCLARRWTSKTDFVFDVCCRITDFDSLALFGNQQETQKRNVFDDVEKFLALRIGLKMSKKTHKQKPIHSIQTLKRIHCKPRHSPQSKRPFSMLFSFWSQWVAVLHSVRLPCLDLCFLLDPTAHFSPSTDKTHP